MTYRDAVKLLKAGRLRFGDDEQIQAVHLIEAVERLRDLAKQAKDMDLECDACDGDGLVECDKCDGEGECPHCGAECPECEGSGEVDCEECVDISSHYTEKNIQAMTLEQAQRDLEDLRKRIAKAERRAA